VEAENQEECAALYEGGGEGGGEGGREGGLVGVVSHREGGRKRGREKGGREGGRTYRGGDGLLADPGSQHAATYYRQPRAQRVA